MTPFYPRPCYRAGALGAALQLLSLDVLVTAGIVLGPRPASAAEAFGAYEDGPLHLLLRGDLVVFGLLLAPYLLTATALFLALRRTGPAVATFAALLTAIAAVGAIATGSTFSLLRLAEHHVSASSEAQRAALLADAEAVVAADLWSASAFAIGLGLLYLVWFPMLAWDFARLARAEHAPTGPRQA